MRRNCKLNHISVNIFGFLRSCRKAEKKKALDDRLKNREEKKRNTSVVAAAAKAEAALAEARLQSPKRKAKKGLSVRKVIDVDALTLSNARKEELKAQLNVVWP